jgi:retron-type reverse transcriptase
MRGTGTERPVGAEKSGRPDGAKGSRQPACGDGQPREREEPSRQAKPFSISKKVVVEAYQRVKAKGGAAGVDGESIEAFEKDLKNNLYKIWNRMSSGTYFPPPVRSVGIPKKDGGERRLGIPTVADRVAQTVVKLYLEPAVEPTFTLTRTGTGRGSLRPMPSR